MVSWWASGSDMTPHRGLNRAKPIIRVTGLQTPPEKKIPKKIFGGPNFFFQEKKFFWFGGFSVIMGFLPNENKTRVIMGFGCKI